MIMREEKMELINISVLPEKYLIEEKVNREKILGGILSNNFDPH